MTHGAKGKPNPSDELLMGLLTEQEELQVELYTLAPKQGKTTASYTYCLIVDPNIEMIFAIFGSTIMISAFIDALHDDLLLSELSWIDW